MRLVFKLRNRIELTDLELKKIEGYIRKGRRKINIELDLRDLRLWYELEKLSKKQRKEFEKGIRKLYK